MRVSITTSATSATSVPSRRCVKRNSDHQQRDEDQQREEHEEAVARGPERRESQPTNVDERVRRRRAQHAVVGQVAVAISWPHTSV